MSTLCPSPAGTGHDSPSAHPFNTSMEPAKSSITTLLLRALDGLSFGVAVLDEVDQPIYANANCRAALMQEGWWSPAGSGACRGTAPERRWHAALEEVRQRGRRRLLPLQAQGTNEAATAPAFIALSPLPVDGRSLVLATLGRGHLCGELELQLYAKAQGLTNAEAQVLAKLATGQRPADIARDHHVALSTVCTQVVAIRGKTETTSVHELLLKLAKLPPVRPALA